LHLELFTVPSTLATFYEVVKIVFQSFFMLMTVQPCFFVSWFNFLAKVPTLLSGGPRAGLFSRASA
jgi:hypothetical protein